jgi:DNA modification methylase
VKTFFEHSCGVLYNGDALSVLRDLPEASIHCCVTSPPYWGLRDYGVAGQLGLERTPEEYVSHMVEVFREVRRVLDPAGTLWLNIGDSYCSDAGRDRVPTTKPGDRVPSGWTNRIPTRRVHAMRKGKDCDPKRGPGAPGQPLGVCAAPGLKPKDLVGIPWMLAFALRADGWYLRSEIIWAKPNPMPESVQDRPTKAHETIFLLAKRAKYFYDAEAIAERTHGAHTVGTKDWESRKSAGEPMRHGLAGAAQANAGQFKPRQSETRNKRSVWTVATEPFPEAHFATFPQALIRPCILAGCPEGGTVLDPFSGAGTTALVAKENGRRFVGIELSSSYCRMSAKRLAQEVIPLRTANETHGSRP